jgi:CBS domain-containing protein
VVESSRGLTAFLVRLVKDGYPAEFIGRAGGAVIDLVARRLIELAIIELGPPPTAYAWLALGSWGRCERTLIGDQDHAVIYRDPTDGAARYFALLAEAVTAGLEKAGLPRCPSNILATHPALNQSAELWIDRFSKWVRGDVEAAFQAEITLDYRRVAGTYPELIERLDRVAARAHNLAFLRHLGQLAVSRRPPLGRWGRVDFEDGSIDLKEGAILPVTELARFFSLASGILATGTCQRLRRVIASGGEWASPAAHLLPAFVSLQDLRLAAQTRRWERGEPIDNRVAADELPDSGPLTVALRAVRHVQDGLQNWLDWTL